MKIWQTTDKDGTQKTHLTEKPFLYSDMANNKFFGCKDDTSLNGFLFPIPLKPLQIAEITVCEDGTWSYEIERQEGWYWARAKATNAVYPLQYKGGIWYSGIGNRIDAEPFTISSTRIPDKCII